MYFIGIDIGGTFTDMALLDEQGRLRTYKVESTPENLARGVLEGLKLAAEDLRTDIGDLLRKTVYFGHGTTAATNAFIQRRGARTGLITTQGFGDTVRLMRMMGLTAGLDRDLIPHYSARTLPPPIVPPELVREVTERVDYKGAEVIPLDEEDARQSVRWLVARGVEAIAICLLWSFRNPAHEQRLVEIVRQEAPGLFVTASSDLVPLIQEYERTSTTMINAYLGPPISSYIHGLESQLSKRGLDCPLLLLNSCGGTISAEEAARKVVLLLLSGPAGGVMGSCYLGETLGYRDIITTDMGGTSFDVGLVVGGESVVASTSVVGRYPLLTPMIDIQSLGAGGGSIASVEEGHLRVGPQSAGARPGPACYCKGGTEPTVTDADVVLGVIDPDCFLGGRVRLSRENAEEAIARRVAAPLGMGVMEAAAGIRQVVDNRMADLVRQVTIERGHDPREFVLFAYGGAGPAHCCHYGAELGVRCVIIPFTATVHSAYGAVASDLHYPLELSELMRTPPFSEQPARYLEPGRIERCFRELEERGRDVLRRSGIPEDRRIMRRKADLRYRRQTHEVMVPVPAGPLGKEEMERLVELFEKRYEELYGKGSAYREAGLEITAFRVEAIGRTIKPALKGHLPGPPDASGALKGERPVYFPELGGFTLTTVYEGVKLHAGNRFRGPAIIEYPGTTALIGVKQWAEVDEYLNLVVRW